jgi:hypothetical protein
MMSGLIIFRCPLTGMDVQTPLQRQQESDPARAYEAFACPACTRIHFINTATGTVSGRDK